MQVEATNNFEVCLPLSIHGGGAASHLSHSDLLGK